VLAPSCAACEALLDHPTRGPVCDRCWQSVRPITPPCCTRCGDPLPSWRTFSAAVAHCPRCRRSPRLVDRAGSIGDYDGALRGIVHAFKYEGRRSLARPLAAMMVARCGSILDGAVCSVPVPLHRSRRHRRGFNQSADLARHLPLPVVAALARVRATASQTGLPAAQRHRNVRGAFAITARAAPLAGGCVVLVDDVRTTGATLEACARALKEEAGVREVRALTAARVAGLLR
jgi:ComF family protein